MSRSKWKGPYVDLNVLKNSKKENHKSSVISRKSGITPHFVGLTFNIYNGKKYVDLTIAENMIGHKFGEFSSTRAKFVFKKNKKK